MDLIVGALFTLGLFAVEVAVVYLHRPPWYWTSHCTWVVGAASVLLFATGLIVRRWGWSPWQKGQLLLFQGIVIPIVSGALALLLVIREAVG